jgi:non-lysosomal glucosylceramidase
MSSRHPAKTLVRLVCAMCALALVPSAVLAAPVELPVDVPLAGAADGETAAAQEGPIHWSFEADMDGWEVDPGSSFGPTRSCRGGLGFHPLRVNKEGECFLSTFETEGPTKELQDGYHGAFGDFNRGVTGRGLSPHFGTISSPRFTLTHPAVSMLISGGAEGGDDTYVAVCAGDGDGCEEIARVYGDDTEWFHYKTVDLTDHVGKDVFLRVVDRATTGWSHVALDNVRANAPAMPRSFTATRDGGAATVSWDAVSEPGIVGYDLYRMAAGGESPWPAQWEDGQLDAFEQVNDTPLTGTTYVDPTASADRGYWYRVAAIADDGLTSEINLTYLRPELQPGLREPGEPIEYAGEQLSGIVYPVGPIGYGGIQHLGDGTRNLSWIFNIDGWFLNTTYGRRDAWVPHSFFAVRAQRDGEAPVVRALQTVEEGPFTPMDSLTFRAEEPIGTYAFADDELPVTVTQHMESPAVPGDLRDSAIPTAIYTLEITNPSDAPATVSLLASQQNAIGFDGQVGSGAIDGRRHPRYGQNTNELTTDEHGAHLDLTGCSEGPVVPVALHCDGGFALSLLDPGATGTASWDTHDSLLADFDEDGTVTGPETAESPEDGVTVDGALTTTFELAPGETRSVPIVFSWFIPTSGVREHGGQGVHYANEWDSAREVHTEVLERLGELTERNRLYRDTVNDSNLPRYVLDRLTSQISTMRSPTVYSAENGFLGGYEGHGCCTGMPSHVWQYAQLAPRLWPEIDAAWQSQWLDQQAPDGALPFRHALPVYAFDGQTGVILGAYRTYLSTGDDAWLNRYWLQIKRAMDYLIVSHDLDGDGILTGSQPMTLDQRLSGTSSWLGSMYLAALKASARMAEATGNDLDAQRYLDIFEAGRVNQEELLWNGEYYAEAPDGHLVELPDLTATSTGPASYGNGLIADMLLGQWWATMLGLGDIYDSDNMTRALRALYEENFKEHLVGDSPFGPGMVWRAYARPTDAGLQMMTWPGDDRPADPPRYHDEVWTGTEYSAAATMIQRGLVDEGLRIVRAAHDRYDGTIRRDMFLWNCGAVDGGGNPFGDDECGKWYARAMSNWSILLALQGFTFDAAAERIGFAPQWQPEDHRSFFTAGSAWGTFSQSRSGAATQTSTLALRSGELSLRRVDLDTDGIGTAHVDVRINGERLDDVTVEDADDGVAVLLPSAETLTAGDTLEIRIAGQPGDRP